MAKKHFYTQKLINLLWSFTNKEVEKWPKRYYFTQGIINTDSSLFATDGKMILKANIPDVPDKLKGNVTDNNGNYIVEIGQNEIDTLEKVCRETRTKMFVLNTDKWKKVYEKVKNKKRPKTYKKISPVECVQLTDGFIVRAKDFNRFVGFCEKNDVRLVKFNEKTYSGVSNYMELVGVNCDYYFYDDEKDYIVKYE